MQILFLTLILLILLALVVFRLIPTDPARWHVPIHAAQDEDRPGGAIRIISGDEVEFAKLAEDLQTLPRTELIAGSVADGRMTFRTRSRVFGFPDFTTIQRDGDQIKLFARLRFGKSDLGVNRTRLERLIAGLNP